MIGADGLRSTVAERVGAPIEHAGTAAGAVVYGYWSGVETDGYEWAYRPGFAAGLIPTNDGLTCVFAGSTPTRIGRGGRAVLDDVVRQASPMHRRTDRRGQRSRRSADLRRPARLPAASLGPRLGARR